MPTTPEFVDDCTFRAISHRSSPRNERTGEITLWVTFRGRYDQLESTVNAMNPGDACTITGYTNLRLRTRPSVNANTGPMRTFVAEYTGWITGDGSNDTIAPMVTYRHERRQVTFNDAKGREMRVAFDAEVALIEWSSRTYRDSPRYSSYVTDRPDPVPLDPEPTDPTVAVRVLEFEQDVDYWIDERAGFLESRQDETGVWHYIEFAEKVIVAKDPS